MQIQSEMERSQRGDVTQEAAGELEEGGVGEEDGEMEDSVDQGVETTNENLAFSFKIPRPSSTIREGRTRAPITPTKISGDPKFLKRTINDLSFTLEPLERKNPRTTRIDESFIFKQILSTLDSLSQTVETQTKHICALEKRVKELNMQTKGNAQANKASQAVTKNIETIAERVAAIAATSIPQTVQTSETAMALNNTMPSPALQGPNQKRQARIW